MIEIFVNKERLDTPGNLQFAYTKQIGDLFDLPAVKSGYTSAFTIDKTDRNIEIFRWAGLPGSTSNLPYIKIKVDILDSGVPIIKSGHLNLISADDKSYKIAVIDGAIDLFKAIEGKTLADLDLTDCEHDKTFDNIVKSWSYNLPYKYIVADYGRELYAGRNGWWYLNTDSLLPAIRMKHLLNKCFQNFGFTQQGYDDSRGMWLVYPSDMNTPDQVFAHLPRKNQSLKITRRANGWAYLTPDSLYYDNDGKKINKGRITGQDIYVVPETGLYRLEVYCHAKVYYTNTLASSARELICVDVYVNNTNVWQPHLQNSASSHEIYLNKGDRLYMRYSAHLHWGAEWCNGARLYSDYLKIVRIGARTGGFRGLKAFSVKDFLKEALIRNALCLIPEDNNTFRLCDIDRRMDKTNAIDLSSKFVRLTDESFRAQNYAQNNLLKHKYPDQDNQGYDDALLRINNENLDKEKTLHQSLVYAPLTEVQQFRGDLTGSSNNDWHWGELRNVKFKKYPVWENDNGKTQLKEDRFFILNQEITQVQGMRLYSDRQSFADKNTRILPYASPFLDTSLRYWVNDAYKNFTANVLNNCKIHRIEIILSPAELKLIPFDRPVYFAQTASHYLVNKIEYKPGSFSKLECLKIN